MRGSGKEWSGLHNMVRCKEVQERLSFQALFQLGRLRLVFTKKHVLQGARSDFHFGHFRPQTSPLSASISNLLPAVWFVEY